jgi:glycosyltransferase involved in cell wall biosynthesis
MNRSAICEMSELRDGDRNALEQADLARELGRVAIVHDYLNQRGGAEKVVLELSDMWPQAPIYTSLYRPDSTFEEFRGRDIRTSFLDRLPVDRGFRNLFPLYPAAFWSFGEIDADVVIASSSGWAHMARVAERAAHIVYCYTPARWLYRDDYLASGGRRARRQAMIAPASGGLRRFDAYAARRADGYVAISEAIRQRLRSVYGFDAPVVYPPVDVERLRPSPRGQRLLSVSRLLPYKRVDLVVAAARQLGLGLDVVGDGPLRNDLRRMAGPETTFHGAAPDATVSQLLETCSAVCVAGEEDFGIVAVEAQAAGKPVVAYGRGGARETVIDGVTGILFEHQTLADIVAAIAACERLETAPARIAQWAGRFSRAAFRAGIRRTIAEARAELESTTGPQLSGATA